MDKNSKIEKSYDELTYKSAAFAQSSPYKLEACATLLGINPPPCKNAKVLEIGCSFGGNLIPFAVNNENARVVGIDLSGEQIRRGKEIVKEIGKNETGIGFANIFDAFKKLNLVDYYIFLLLDGKNTFEEITAKSLKFIKENSIKISDKNGKEFKNEKLVAHIKSYVIGTAKIASMLYLLEEI